MFDIPYGSLEMVALLTIIIFFLNKAGNSHNFMTYIPRLLKFHTKIGSNDFIKQLILEKKYCKFNVKFEIRIQVYFLFS